jgi:hypothetical protein
MYVKIFKEKAVVSKDATVRCSVLEVFSKTPDQKLIFCLFDAIRIKKNKITLDTLWRKV